MSIGTAIMSLLLAMLIAGVSGQPQTVSGSASVSVSASSLQDLQNQIQSEAEKAFSSLDSSASNLNAAVQQLTQVVAQAVAGVLVNLLESGSVNATAAGIEISGAVGGALSAAASSAGGELANLDVDSISADISKSVESTINGATASTSSAELTQEVAQQVLNTLGEGLAEVTGGQFSAQVSVTSVATAAPIALNLVNVDVSGAARLILELMANGSYADAVSQMSKVLLDGGTDQIKEVLTTSVDQGLNQSFIQVMTRIYQNSSFPILPFSVSLGTAFGEVENQGAFVDLLGQVFTIVNQSGDYPNLREALYYAFTSQGGNIRAAYDQSLSSAIEESGCSSVAQVLAAGKDRADQLGLGTLFMIAIQNNPDINECLQVGVELQVSIDILGQLADTQRAVELILDAISKGQIITISNLIIQAIQEGQFTELQQVLTQVFCDEGIQQDQLVEAISATVADGENQGLTNVTNVLGQILADASCNNQASRLKILNEIVFPQKSRLANFEPEHEFEQSVGMGSQTDLYGRLNFSRVPEPDFEFEKTLGVGSKADKFIPEPEYEFTVNNNLGVVYQTEIRSSLNVFPAPELDLDLDTVFDLKIQYSQILSFYPVFELDSESQENLNSTFFNPFFERDQNAYGNSYNQVFLQSKSDPEIQESLNPQVIFIPELTFEIQPISIFESLPLPEPDQEFQENFNAQADLPFEFQQNLSVAPEADLDLNLKIFPIPEPESEIQPSPILNFQIFSVSGLDSSLNISPVTKFNHEIDELGELKSYHAPEFEQQLDFNLNLNSNQVPNMESNQNLGENLNEQFLPAVERQFEFDDLDKTDSNSDSQLFPVSEQILFDLNSQNFQIQSLFQSALSEDADFEFEPDAESDSKNKQKEPISKQTPQTEILVVDTSQLLQQLVINSSQIFQQINLPVLYLDNLQSEQIQDIQAGPQPEPELQFNQSEITLDFQPQQDDVNQIVDEIYNLGTFVHDIVIYSSKYEFKVKEEPDVP